MNKQNKLKTIIICLSIIALISIFFNIYLITTRTKPLEQDNNQIINNNENIIDDINDDEKKNNDTNIVEIGEKEEQEPKKEYIYKYIDGKEKEVVVEKEIKVEVPASPTDATITYIDASGNSKSIKIPSGTTIDFSAGEHGTYDSVPASITLTDNQELDITDSSYNPSKVEVNYIFKGFSYSGNTMKCEYSLTNNTVNVDHKQIDNAVIINDVVYIKHEYLESTGTQYIDTGISFNASDYNGEIIFQYTNTTNNTWIFGAVDSSYVGCEAGISSGVFFIGAGFSYSQNNTGSKTTGTFSTFSFSPVNKNFYLFARNAPTLANVKAKVFSCKIKKGTELKLDLVPGERISDGKIGMLDFVSGTLLTRQGSGEFNYPDDVVLIPGINAGKVMASGSYESGSTLTLTAIANDGYKFAKWLDGNTNATRTINVENSTVYTALFVANN